MNTSIQRPLPTWSYAESWRTGLPAHGALLESPAVQPGPAARLFAAPTTQDSLELGFVVPTARRGRRNRRFEVTMANEQEPELNSWLVPVYGEKPKPRALEQFAVCRHCNQIRRDHAGEEEKCLFDSTTFAVLKSPIK